MPPKKFCFFNEKSNLCRQRSDKKQEHDIQCNVTDKGNCCKKEKGKDQCIQRKSSVKHSKKPNKSPNKSPGKSSNKSPGKSKQNIGIGSKVKWTDKKGKPLTGTIEEMTKDKSKCRICCKPGKKSGEKDSRYLVSIEDVELDQ